VLTRRRLLACAAALPLGGQVCWGAVDASAPSIAMAGTPMGTEVWFDPIGLWVPPGTMIRWFIPPGETQSHAAAAYHPSNQNHPRRIPEQATAWDSGYLRPGEDFQVRLTVEGVYDYYCRPHEEAGMVGRIVVGTPSGHDLDDFANAAKTHPDWRPVPEQALRIFPSVEDILRHKTIPRQAG